MKVSGPLYGFMGRVLRHQYLVGTYVSTSVVPEYSSLTCFHLVGHTLTDFGEGDDWHPGIC